MRNSSYRLLRVALTVASLAMLTACADSPAKPVALPVAAPVFEMHTEVRLACPAELDAPVATAPVVPDGAAVTGSEAGLRWLGEVIAWGQSLLDRLTDAREACQRG